MRLMYTTAVTSALLLAGPALAAGDKVEGTTGMTAPEASAAQLPGDSAEVRKNFESAGFNGWREAPDAYILRMQSAAGQPVWVVLTPEGSQVGAAQSQPMDRDAGALAAAPGSDISEQDAGGGMPQRGDRADISETFEGAEGGERQDVAGAPELPGQQDQPQGESQLLPSGPPATEVPQEGREFGTARQDGQMGEQADVAEAEEGTAGQTEPEGFAAQIPGELQSELEGAGFKQVASVDGANIFHARTKDGQSAFIIIGDLGGFEGQQ